MSSAYFQAKRNSGIDVIGIEGMDSMAFVDKCIRSRGIKSWELARYEANAQRQKNATFYHNRDKIQRLKNQQAGGKSTEELVQEAKEAKKRRDEAELAMMAQRRREVENPFEGYVDTGVVDAWDD